MHGMILIAFIYTFFFQLIVYMCYYCLLCYYYVQEQKLPRCVVPHVMDDYHDEMHGSKLMNGANYVPRDCEFKIGDRWISVLHHGHAGVFLFFKIVPKGEEYRASSYDG